MSEPEVWLRGALPDVAPLLQPVAHSLLQCRLEVRATVPTLSPTELWVTPGGAASAGYHVRHAARRSFRGSRERSRAHDALLHGVVRLEVPGMGTAEYLLADHDRRAGAGWHRRWRRAAPRSRADGRTAGERVRLHGGRRLGE